MADLLFDWLEFDQTSETVLHSTKAKQLNPNKLNKRSAIYSDTSLMESFL